ncbi:cytochrome o ubiquinol oxidase subunit IV [Altericroceibacterium endophyticum]|uniref:Cytochrome bo(3) ubiquinol oxidase subunit 4 n=1 Tax=Altericroceibacterium endophyticum TaxID=1808508 RepID=A0A6I4TAG6_9SPHN|nr:cytochrome C oxidase subunit IV family protein [Altericroceibacterium endophyticum]MXO67013.1 cytochrome-c oxidase [Altericroceibacterium endophyticum]
MTKPNTGELNPQESAASEIKSYATGFIVSLLLTVGAFAALLSDLPSTWKIVLICVAALLQIIVHMRNFLHLSFSGGQSREDLLLVLFSVCLLAIMAGGTWYIMSDLGGRMHQASGSDAAMPEAPTR